MAKTKPTLLPRIENKNILKTKTKIYLNNKSQTHLAAQKPAKIQINILKNKETATIKPTSLPRSQQDLVHSQNLCRTRRSRCLSARKLIEIFISFTSISSGYLSARKLIEISSFSFLQETHLSFCDTGAFIEYFVNSIMTFYEQNRQIW